MFEPMVEKNNENDNIIYENEIMNRTEPMDVCDEKDKQKDKNIDPKKNDNHNHNNNEIQIKKKKET